MQNDNKWSSWEYGKQVFTASVWQALKYHDNQIAQPVKWEFHGSMCTRRHSDS